MQLRLAGLLARAQKFKVQIHKGWINKFWFFHQEKCGCLKICFCKCGVFYSYFQLCNQTHIYFERMFSFIPFNFIIILGAILACKKINGQILTILTRKMFKFSKFFVKKREIYTLSEKLFKLDNFFAKFSYCVNLAFFTEFQQIWGNLSSFLTYLRNFPTKMQNLGENYQILLVFSSRFLKFSQISQIPLLPCIFAHVFSQLINFDR